MSTGVQTISDRQRKLIHQLAAERQYDLDDVDVGALTGGREGTATKLIDKLFALPNGRNAVKRDKFVPEPGFYLTDEQLVKVFVAKERGNWYAKVARVKEGEGEVSWSYRGQRVVLRKATPITEEQAQDYLVVMTP